MATFGMEPVRFARSGGLQPLFQLCRRQYHLLCLAEAGNCLALARYDARHFPLLFKFPSTISHQAALRQCETELATFYQTLAPLHNRIGQLWLQLPAAFGPNELPRLWQFLDKLPTEFSYGVEIRHPAFC